MTDPDVHTPDRTVSALGTRREWLQAGAIFTLLIMVFLWKPLTSGGVYGPGDLSQAVPILRTTPAEFEVANPLLGDVSSDIMPWQMYTTEHVRNGELPLWNSYNESGVPHLANAQSAVFSPFTYPFYVAPFRLALVASVAMALLVASVSTYGLSRRLKAGHWGGIVAGVGFTYSAVNMVWLRWPLLPATALIPATAWGAIVTLEADSRSRRLLGTAALAVSVALGTLSGHPETTFYGLAGVVVLAGLHLAAHPLPRQRLLRRIGAVAAAIVTGAAIAAAQVLPTLEYLSVRAPSGDRQAFVDGDLAGLIFTPFLQGSPVGANRAGLLPEAIPYVKAAQLSLSVVVIMLAAVGAFHLCKRRPRIGAAAVAVGVVWWLFAFNVVGIGRFMVRLPGLDLLMALRSSPLFALAVALLAGRGVAVLLDGRGDLAEVEMAPASNRKPELVTDRSRLVVLAAAAMASVAAVGVAAFSLRNRFVPAGDTAGSDLSSLQRSQLMFVLAWLIVGVGALVAGIVVISRQGHDVRAARLVRSATGLVLVVAVFATSGFMWRGFNPTVEKQHFYARSEAITRVKDIVGFDLTIGADSSEIPPALNMAYQLRSPYNYDAIGVGTYQEVFRRLLRPQEKALSGTSIGLLAGPVAPHGTGNLRMLGIRWVTTGATYPWANRDLLLEPGQPARDATGWTLGAGGLDGQTGGTVSGLVFDDLPSEAHTCTVTTEPVTSGSPPWEWSGPCQPDGLSVPFDSPASVASGLQVSLSVTDEQGRPLTMPATAPVHAIDSAVRGLDLRAEVDGFRVYRVPDATQYGFSPANTVSHDPGNAVVDDPEARPHLLSFIDGADGTSEGERPGQVDLRRNTSGTIDLTVDRETPGWVIINEADFPGWTATVDGDAATIRRANGAFMAVPVPAGSSQVQFRYQPTSVKLGLAISIASSIGLALVIGYALLRERRRTA